MAGGDVDPRWIALLEVPPPPLVAPADPSHEQATITRYEPDLIRLDVRTGAPGLVVLSEVYYPGWRAYVDEKPATLYVADHVLRAVAVPAGSHTIELRYEDPALRGGLMVTVATALAFAVAFGTAGYRGRTSRDANALVATSGGDPVQRERVGSLRRGSSAPKSIAASQASARTGAPSTSPRASGAKTKR
jgi:hypothetical protein